MTTTPKAITRKSANIQNDEDDEQSDSRAVIMENQYLKNQVAALTRLVEEEKEKAQRERELRDNIS